MIRFISFRKPIDWKRLIFCVVSEPIMGEISFPFFEPKTRNSMPNAEHRKIQCTKKPHADLKTNLGKSSKPNFECFTGVGVYRERKEEGEISQ